MEAREGDGVLVLVLRERLEADLIGVVVGNWRA